MEEGERYLGRLDRLLRSLHRRSLGSETFCGCVSLPWWLKVLDVSVVLLSSWNFGDSEGGGWVVLRAGSNVCELGKLFTCDDDVRQKSRGPWI